MRSKSFASTTAAAGLVDLATPFHHLRSTNGVDTLIARACARYEFEALSQIFSPLFPEEGPWPRVASVCAHVADKWRPELRAITAAVADYRTSLTASAGELAPLLNASEEGVRALALSFAKLDLSGCPDLTKPGAREVLLAQPSIIEFPGMVDLLSLPVLPQSAMDRKLLWAQMLLRTRVLGDTKATQIARISDARFWRRAIRVRLMRERELFFLRLRLVGKASESYVSDVQLFNRLSQLKRQTMWMESTVLVPRRLEFGKKLKKIPTLSDVASSPSTRFAKLYTFVSAMDAIARDKQLATGMLTLTLEPEWHPNPSHGVNSWNGASPREAHQSLAQRWQSILRDLDRLGIGVSGLRVVEPHKDACPHWHIWLLYRPELEQQILEVVMRYFPNKLKLRGVRGSTAGSDAMFDSLSALKAHESRALTHTKEGAQVELARIDRSISSGASYAMKYLLKTVNAGPELNQDVGLFPATDSSSSMAELAANDKKREQHAATAKRVDAYRSLWGINAAQLFGVAKCLTAWDELRALGLPPGDAQLRKLWELARGGKKKGRIKPGSGVRGDAKGFIEALGGLAACGKAPKGAKRLSIGRLTETGQNGYGEEITRTKGVTLIERKREKVIVDGRVLKTTGEIKPVYAWRSLKSVIASVKTRLKEWMLVPTKHAESAIERLKKRQQDQLEAGSQASLGALAVREFWGELWDGLKALGWTGTNEPFTPAPQPGEPPIPDGLLACGFSFDSVAL